MTLKRFAVWITHLRSEFTFSGSSDADTAKLEYYSFTDRVSCTAEFNLEKGIVKWTRHP